MKLLRFGIGALSLAAAAFACASPGVLIVQLRAPMKDKLDPNVDLTEALAKEYDESGRLAPIIYSSSDPIIKAALSTGTLKGIYPNPSNKEISDTARKLRVSYVLVVSSLRAGTNVKAKIELYKDRSQIWKDEQTMSISSKEILDPVSTVASIAHTFVIKMDSTTLKALPSQPKVKNPTLQQGQTPSVAQTLIQLTPEKSQQEVVKDVDELVKNGKTGDAILKLRDSVDAAPFSFERRKELIEMLGNTLPADAAVEARRAATVLPEKSELRVMAARYWMKAGQPDEAQKDLNEAIARDPNGFSTRMMLAEVSLLRMEPDKALPHLDEAIKASDGAEPRFLRAICRAELGGTDGMQIDMAQVGKLEPSKTDSIVQKRYSFMADIMDRALARDGVDLKTLIPKLIVRPDDAGLKDDLDQMIRLVLSRTALLAAVEPPASRRLQHDQRVLAYRLMYQALLGVQTYARTRDEDTLADARINMGESLKQLATAKG